MPLHLKDGTSQRRFNLSNETENLKQKIKGRVRKKASTFFNDDEVNNNNKKGKYMSRKQRRANNQKQHQENGQQNQADKYHFELRHIQPLTVNQEKVFDAIMLVKI